MKPQQTPATPRTAPQAPQAPVPIAAPGGVVVPPNADLATLQAALAELKIQHAGLTAEWNGLRRQLDNMLQNNPARPGVQQQWADVGIQRAQVEGQMAIVEARISQKTGQPASTAIARPPARGIPPQMIAGGAITLALAFVVPMAIAMAIRIARRGRSAVPPSPNMDYYAARFDRIEQAVDAIAIEVERVSEGQRFVTKILAERPADASPLALGAGPAESVRVNERQGVREPISTPRRDL